MDRQPVVMAWSGGKDSALAYGQLLDSDRYVVKGLLTTVGERTGKVMMHQTPLGLVRKQAALMDQPLYVVSVPESPSNKTYEHRMGKTLLELKKKGISKVVFGDIFLDDLRAYREKMLQKLEMAAVFPLWKKDTQLLMGQFFQNGYQAVVNIVDAKKLPGTYVGRKLTTSLVNGFPAEVDPSGENGEYHSFVWDAPYFPGLIQVACGENKTLNFSTMDAGFIYCDLFLTHP